MLYNNSLMHHVTHQNCVLNAERSHSHSSALPIGPQRSTDYVVLLKSIYRLFLFIKILKSQTSSSLAIKAQYDSIHVYSSKIWNYKQSKMLVYIRQSMSGNVIKRLKKIPNIAAHILIKKSRIRRKDVKRIRPVNECRLIN